MNILWIYDRPLNPEAGGTERMTSLLSKGFSALGHNCYGILVFNRSDSTMYYNSDKVEDLHGFLTDRKIDIVFNQISYSEWLLKLFLENGGKKWKNSGGKIISCLHFDPKNPSILFLYLLKKHKTITDYISILKFITFYRCYKKRQQKQEGEIYNYIYDNSDLFVTLSPTHFEYLKYVMKKNEYSKLTAVNNPLTFDDISEVEILEEKEPIAIVCARMSEYHKRVSIILKAWLRIKKTDISAKWKLIILGDGPDLDSYKEFVSSHHIPDVIFKGQVNPEPYYRIASVLLLTSSAEGWGLTITEGLQRGVVPVVMHSCPVFQEIINDGYNGFLTRNNDIKAFTARVIELMTNTEELIMMQENALDSAEQFSLGKTMIKWESILRKLS